MYAEPIVLFTNVLCIITKSCMPKTTAKQKKQCKSWFNTECKDAMKARMSTWDMVRGISAKYKANTVSHLKYNNNAITDVKEICNTVAKHFYFNSSSDNYSHMFTCYRLSTTQTFT